MTDVTVAPASAPNPTPQAQSEVPVNPNPQSSPNPLGPQAPPAPVDIKGSEHRPQSRREAIQAAFDRANGPQPKTAKPAEKPAPKAAEAKKGHNQPPEDVPDEKFSLKKRPAEAPPRGEKGQFARREVPSDTVRNAQNANQSAAGTPQPDANTQTADYPRLPKHVPYHEPPQRITERARRDWAAAPESVRGEIWRQQAEFAKAYQYYKGAHEAFKPIKHFHEMAQKHGTTLEAALTNFVGIEQKLRENPIAGIDQILHNLNLTDPETGRRLGARDWAYTVLSQTPEQLQQVQQGNQQQAQSYQIGALHQKIEKLEKQNEEMQYRQQFTYTRSAIDQFAATHPRFDKLGKIIENELKLGFDLETAYRRAELLQPATHADQTRTTPAQTRPSDKSIHGNPDVAPSNGASRKPKIGSPTPRDAVQNALNRLNGVH